VGLSLAEYRAQVGRIGLALIGQTAELAPADRRLYALRDVTATVECIPLICASILSKKLAEGTDVLVADVKFGRGAFMKDKSRARELAVALVAAARAMGKPTRAVLTVMDEPLGLTVGNALEVAESIACLKGSGPEDLMEVTYALGEQMLVLAGAAATLNFRQPIAVLLPSTLPFIPSTGQAAAILSTLQAALSPGSYLALCHVASDLDPAVVAGAAQWNRMSSLHITPRSRAEVTGLITGLDLVEPGLVPVDEWHPAAGNGPDRPAPVYAMLGRKP